MSDPPEPPDVGPGVELGSSSTSLAPLSCLTEPGPPASASLESQQAFGLSLSLSPAPGYSCVQRHQAFMQLLEI